MALFKVKYGHVSILATELWAEDIVTRVTYRWKI